MLISDWSSDVCSSDLVSFEREHPSLDRPCAVFAPRAVPLRLQDAPAGARLGHAGLGRPLQEISDAGDAQAAIPVPDAHSDPDRERAFRLFGDRGLAHAHGCWPRLPRGLAGPGLSLLAPKPLPPFLTGGQLRP